LNTEIYKDDSRNINVTGANGEQLIIYRGGEVVRRLSLSTATTDFNLSKGVPEVLKAKGENPNDWFTLYSHKGVPSAVLPKSAKVPIDQAINRHQTQLAQLETERNKPSTKERNEIFRLYSEAERIAESGRENNVTEPIRLRARADKMLREWRERYPIEARKERQRELIEKAEHQEELAKGALIYDADGWISSAEQQKRHDDFIAKANELRRQSKELDGDDSNMASEPSSPIKPPSIPQTKISPADPRSAHAEAVDKGIQAKTVTNSPIDWAKRRNQIDLEGVDTKQKLRFRTTRRTSKITHDTDLGAGIVKDRHGRHLKLS
jgi:hypothetical protein